MRHILRRDKNHCEIVRELEQRGVCVLDLAASGSGVTDLATYYRGSTVFIEIKFGAAAELKKTQIKFLSSWRGWCGIARDINEACGLAMRPGVCCLTPRQKDRLAAFYVQMPGSKAHLATVLKLIDAAGG